jgi:hypothetical protein
MTTDDARQHREFCEAAILRLLHELTVVTGLDIAAVNVSLIVAADTTDSEPRRIAHSVRIDLAV